MGKKYIDKWIEENMVKPDLSTAHAYYNSGTGIAVNFDKQDFDKFLKMRMANVANGYHPIGCESFESMIDHEFGHLLDTTYSIRSGNTEFVKLLSVIDMDDIKNTLAEYATINQDELIAEAWTSYVNNPGHGEIADKIGNMIVDASKRKVV